MKILSLGWGVQSFTLAAMAALGHLPKPDVIIHADTTHERTATYDFVAKWSPWLAERGLDIVTVQSPNTKVVNQSKSSPSTYTFIPVFTQWHRNGDKGQTKRGCTYQWKIAPINSYLRKHYKGQECKIWIGFTLDEAHRCKVPQPNAKIQEEYPLLFLHHELHGKMMTRTDCVSWLLANGLDIPPKSACVFCPFHSKRAWQELRRDEADWEKAVAVDMEIRRRVKADGSPNVYAYLHKSCEPLEDAILKDEDMAEMDFDDEGCQSGMCFI